MTPTLQRAPSRRRKSTHAHYGYVPQHLEDVVQQEPGSKASPELELAEAVFREAIIDLHRGPLHRYRLIYAETRRWVRAESARSWPYSFRSLCSLFALDEDAVRERLLKIKPSGRGKATSTALRGESRKKAGINTEQSRRVSARWRKGA